MLRPRLRFLLRRLLPALPLPALVLVAGVLHAPPAGAQGPAWTLTPSLTYRANYPQGWGQQSSRILFDGEWFYTTENSQAGANRVLRARHGTTSFQSASTVFNGAYQSSAVVADYHGRLVLVAPQAYAPPVIRITATAPNAYANFADVAWSDLPTLSTRAAYISVAAFSNGPAANHVLLVYFEPDGGDTWIAKLDLNNLAAGWSTNRLNDNNADEQWLYPVIHVRNLKNINIAFSSAPVGQSRYTKTLYVRTDWRGVIASKEYIRTTSFNSYITDMILGPDGRYHFAVRDLVANSNPYDIYVVTRRGLNDYRWTRLGTSPYAANLTHTVLYARPGDARLHALTARDTELKLYTSLDHGATFAVAGQTSGPCCMGYSSGPKQSGGGVWPDAPFFTMSSGVAGGGAGRYTQHVVTVGWPALP